MKKLISLCIAVVMLLSLCAVSATAANGPMPTDPEGFVGARIGFSQMDAPESAYVVNDKGSGIVINNSAYPGASYDLATNTLTLDNVDAAGSSLFIWYMGDDFKLKVVGDCAVGIIYVSNQFNNYNTNLNIVGDGSLTVNESKAAEAAIYMFADGRNCPKLSVDASVTLHLYGAENDGLIINNYGTTAATAAEAISVAGAGIDGVVGERIVYTDYDSANLMVVRSRTKQFTDGYVAKSKTDPTGKYSVSWWGNDENRYVKHYVYAAGLGLWVVDQDFGEWGGSTRSYSKEEFENEYTIEQSEQPVTIRYTDDEREAQLGYEITQLAKADEPGVVYGGSDSWRSQNPDYSKPEGYTIYRLNWDEEQGVYVEDESVSSDWVSVDEMEEKGWSIVTKTDTVQKVMDVWCNYGEYGDDDRQYRGKVYRDKHNGEEYVQTGTFTSDSDEGVVLRKIWYDEANETYYVRGNLDQQLVSTVAQYERLEFLYDPVFETVTENVRIRYINSYYGFNSYSNEGTLTQRAGDTGLYVARSYTYAGGNTEYSVQPVELRANGHYYALKWETDDSGYFVRNYTPAEFADEGYSFVTTDQDTPFTHVGQVEFFTDQKYTDAQGNFYAVEWDGTVYSYSEDGLSLTFGETTYYEATLSEKTADELISSEREIETDMYHYSLKGDAYHHEGGAAATSLLGDADGDGKVTILDATCIQRKLANLTTTSYNAKAADADEDGKVTILDATAIQRKLANLPTHEGIGVKRV